VRFCSEKGKSERAVSASGAGWAVYEGRLTASGEVEAGAQIKRKTRKAKTLIEPVMRKRKR
jgi:hypothetical protein